jgi:hypothetical protein
MQKWEYTKISFRIDETGERGIICYADEIQMKYPFEPLHTFMKQQFHNLGSTGWELVMQDSEGFYIFKRPQLK